MHKVECHIYVHNVYNNFELNYW